MRACHELAAELDDPCSNRPLASETADAELRKEVVRALLGELLEE